MEVYFGLGHTVA